MAISNTPQTTSDHEREIGGFPMPMKDRLCGVAALAAVLAVTLPLGSAVQAAATSQAAMNMLNPYIAAGKFKPFDGDIELVPGIRARAAHGHTAGHTVCVVDAQRKRVFADAAEPGLWVGGAHL